MKSDGNSRDGKVFTLVPGSNRKKWTADDIGTFDWMITTLELFTSVAKRMKSEAIERGGIPNKR